jgi:deazaflavin-dependent oxidoreductase (nitroreductase family)
MKPPKVANDLIIFLLHSPLHRLISNQLLLLTYTGRKSGKQVSVPLGYVRQGNTILLLTDHAWYKNVQTNPQVSLRIQGKTYTGSAEVIADDKAIVEQEMIFFVKQRPGGARAYGVKMLPSGEPDLETVKQAVRRFTAIRISLP